MHEILKKTVWSDQVPRITEFVLDAPEIARAHQAGQFVIIINGETGERIPLTIAAKDAEKGTISILFQEVGASTMMLGQMNEGDKLMHVAGPLGKPTHVEKFGTVVCIGGGVGIAPVHPIAQAMKAAGNRVISILGARNKDLLIYEDYMRAASHEVRITTDDGSYHKKGFVTDELKGMIEVEKIPIDLVVVIGPPIMMKFVCKVTEPHKIQTFASLNTIMVDGTGMCGACRVTVGGQTKFVCVDGPEFDGHQVDYDEMMARQRQYLPEEKLAVDICKKKMCHSA
ncbi:MAG: sulfide/dihydroorotate dehydrogenase-like FAD/NAD-binding protein [Nitrospirae bacterium]|nr:sulfide/dihydroorotate dehydrogenase-like FAD/NAD-binding protein [Nitrospirota bacterium]MBI5694584.1 sulfide/dihydroorotate dehydrogenase-like FAD/NAD-binding protein [Nitrospirota bacterium]